MDPAPSVPRKRRWFQIHLSTAIVLMFAAGVLMWLNFLPPKIVVTNLSSGEVNVQVVGQGWPHCWQGEWTSTEPYEPVLKDRQVFLGPDCYAKDNLKVGLLILAAIAATLEYLIRRRERAKA